ncbi:MAG: hypothetical protein CL878_12605 [Dehalococcoidia bacterium]|nr:hypothetical protein [Dehalococcoidia bacterium]
MILALALAIGIVALLYVAYPMLRTSQRWDDIAPAEEPETTAQLADLLTRQQETYAALRELSLDHRSGALDEPTYQRQRQRYERRALALLKALDSWEASADATLAELGVIGGNGTADVPDE